MDQTKILTCVKLELHPISAEKFDAETVLLFCGISSHTVKITNNVTKIPHWVYKTQKISSQCFKVMPDLTLQRLQKLVVDNSSMLVVQVILLTFGVVVPMEFGVMVTKRWEDSKRF